MADELSGNGIYSLNVRFPQLENDSPEVPNVNFHHRTDLTEHRIRPIVQDGTITVYHGMILRLLASYAKKSNPLYGFDSAATVTNGA
jgi:hypothetical protein